jgi:hypothetical protein
MQMLMQFIFHTFFRTAFRLFAAGFALAFALWHSAHAATPQTFRGLKIEVVGEGCTVLRVPGLNRLATNETCEVREAVVTPAKAGSSRLPAATPSP